MAIILTELQNTRIPRDRRGSVALHYHPGTGRGMVLGQVMQRHKGMRLSRASKKNQNLTRMLCLYARNRFADLPFTSIQVNKGGTRLHYDTRNMGKTAIQTWGEYEGGDLYTYPDVITDVRRGFVFDGREPHATMPFHGERYSVCWFVHGDRGIEMTLDEEKMYRRLGFWPNDFTSVPRVRVQGIESRMAYALRFLERWAEVWLRKLSVLPGDDADDADCKGPSSLAKPLSSFPASTRVFRPQIGEITTWLGEQMRSQPGWISDGPSSGRSTSCGSTGD
jgi:hypothetical protein